MDFTLSEQMWSLLWSLALGVFLATIYDLFRFIRVLTNGSRLLIFILDLLFMLTAAFLSVFFAIAFSRGSLRYFTFIGELLGFSLYFFTIGRLTVKLFSLVGKISLRVIKIVTDYYTKTEKKLLQLIKRILYNKYRKDPESHKS